MELRFSEAEETLRSEVRDFLVNNIPAPASSEGPGGARENDDDFDNAVDFNRKLADRGLPEAASVPRRATVIDLEHRVPPRGEELGERLEGPPVE